MIRRKPTTCKTTYEGSTFSFCVVVLECRGRPRELQKRALAKGASVEKAGLRTSEKAALTSPDTCSCGNTVAYLPIFIYYRSCHTRHHFPRSRGGRMPCSEDNLNVVPPCVVAKIIAKKFHVC